MEVAKIYFDMDGVLADFDRGVVELCGLEPSDQAIRDEEKTNELYAAMRRFDHFYDELKPIPGAIELFEELYKKYGNKCEILSGIPKPKRGIINAGTDKIHWCERLLPEGVKANIVFREEKHQYCIGKEAILIDDLQTNIDEWEAAGGTGIWFESVACTREKLRELGVL